jgi:hypothetical protein
MSAYIVAIVGPGKSRDVAPQIASLPGVKMANVCGATGVFAVVEVAESQELKKLVTGKIEKLKGVGGTSTHIALD